MHALREIRGIEATKEIEAAPTEAAAWLEMSGAKSYEPFLHVERAELARLTDDEAARERELREARRLFLDPDPRGAGGNAAGSVTWPSAHLPEPVHGRLSRGFLVGVSPW